MRSCLKVEKKNNPGPTAAVNPQIGARICWRPCQPAWPGRPSLALKALFTLPGPTGTQGPSMNTADDTVTFLDLPPLTCPLSDLQSLTDVCWLFLEARAGLGYL